MSAIISSVQSMIQSHRDKQRILLALSGGCDSMVLLSVLAQLRADGCIQHALQAVHVNHQLSPLACHWVEFCEQQCAKLHIPLEIVVVNIPRVSEGGESLEAQARVRRYEALAQYMDQHSLLLTAHHRDDQAETFLLQALRGAGPKGLAAMPRQRVFAGGVHARPLLTFSRRELNRYAVQHALEWIDDDSNENCRFDRNYLRHQVMPLLQKRWPAYNKTLARAADLCAQSVALNETIVAHHLSRACAQDAMALSIPYLQTLSLDCQTEVIRLWCRQRGVALPYLQHCREIQQQMLYENYKATTQITWANVCVRRYRQHLYVFTDLQPNVTQHVNIPWTGEAELTLPQQLGTLVCEKARGVGITPHSSLTIRFRRGGERFHPHGRCGSHPLKKCLQEWGVPPWLRDRIPLIFVENELIAVVGYAIAAQYSVKADQDGYLFTHVLY